MTVSSTATPPRQASDDDDARETNELRLNSHCAVSAMHRILSLLLCMSLHGAARAADVAISIRYLHPKGTSHAAVFLYTSDGKLVRQLTEPTDSQDVNPAFSPDGKSLIFTSQNDKTSKQVLVS